MAVGRGLWREALVGSAVIVVAAIIGWRFGAIRDAWFVRVIEVWMRYVLDPLRATRSWLVRMVMIFINNSLACGLLVLAGGVGSLGWLAALLMGLALGCGMRRLSASLPIEPGEFNGQDDPEPRSAGSALLHLIGLLLNLLEVPAIMLSVGLSLAQGGLSAGLDRAAAIEIYLSVVVPLLGVAAGGEALWMAFNRAFSRPPQS